MSRHTAQHGNMPGVHGGRRRHIWPWIVLAVLVVVAAAAGITAYTFYKQAMEVKAHEEKAISLMSGLKGLSGSGASGISKDTVDSINAVLPQLQSETATAEQITNGKLWTLASHMPVYGNDITTVRGMTRIVHSLTTESIPQLSSTLGTLVNTPLTTDDGSLNLEPITQAATSMKAANEPLQKLVKEYDALPQPKIGKVATAYASGEQQLNAAGTTINNLSNALDIIPGFLGSGGAKTYAVMAMTTSEARSSGGLLGSVGTDAQRSAEGMRAIWQRTPWGVSQSLDGVMMVDPVFLQKMVAINGQATLSDGRVLDGTNTAEFLLNTVYQEYPVSMQDRYFTEVATQSISAMFSNINLEKLTQVGQAMSSLAQNRHFSMYSFDETTENSLLSAGFTASTPSDEANPKIGVYITEQNPSKMDWYVHRTTKITRTSCNSDGSQTYHVEYTLNNTMTNAELAKVPDYIAGGVQVPSLARGMAAEKMLIYAPAGGSISNITTSGNGTVSVAPKQTTLNGKSVTTTLVLLNPGKSMTYSFDVTTSTKATADLGVDQTPMGWEDPGVSVDTPACAIGTK